MKKNQEKSSVGRRSNLFVKRLVILFFTIGFFSLQGIAKTNPQSAIIELNFKNASLVKIFNEIKLQTEYTFLYNVEDVKKVKNVSIKKKTYQVGEVLNQCLKDTDLSFELRDNVIIIKPKAKDSNSSIQQDNKVIRGVVVDESGIPMPGVSISIKGTNLGIYTDIDGKFELKVPSGSKLIIVSTVGMKTQELAVSTKPYSIILVEDSISMDEVIVTGYQKIDRKLFTGSAQKVSAEDIKVDGAADISSSLQGKVSGVQVSNVSSSFGSAPVITIRGNSSINGNNQPLWVIDGVELENLVNVSADDLTSGNLTTLLSSGVAGLNQEDIESFDILKDVSATALYGAKAMNGVIVITTKQGKEGRLSVNYNGSTSIKMKPSYSDFDIMDSGSEMSVYRQLVDYGWVGMTTVAQAPH